MEDVDIILAETDLGVSIDGSELGPKAIIDNIDNRNLNIKELKKQDIEKEKDTNNLKKNLKYVNEFNNRLYNEVSNTLNNNKFPITIGGDHSIAIASALSSIKKYENLGIIWVDAHSDFNTFDTTITGNIHGLPLAAVTGYERKELTFFHDGNFYPYKNTVIIGARDIDKLEYDNLKDANITVFTTDDIHKYGVSNIVKKALEIATNNTNGIHISYDIDVIDPNIAKGVSVSAVNGITEKEAYDILDELLNYDKIRSFDLVEYNPTKDKDKNTLQIATNLLNKVINKK